MPPGPGDALVLAVSSALREELVTLGWHIRSIPVPAGDLSGFGLGLPTQCADLVAVDHALSPLHHADKRAAVVRIRHWLRPGGTLLIREPMQEQSARRWLRFLPRGRLLEVAAHTGQATEEFWITAVANAGFEAPTIVGRLGVVAVLEAHRPISGGSAAGSVD